MRCPTCSNELTDGAMFCGHCGRAITTADWAAFRAAAPSPLVAGESRSPADAAGADAADPGGSRPWAVRESEPAVVPAGTAWWINEDAPERDVDVIEEEDAPDAAVPAAPSPVAMPEPVSAPQPVSAFDESAAFLDTTSAPAVGAAADDDGPQEPPHPADTSAPVASQPVAAPAPLRPPAAGDPGVRPGSVPLWTASITPITDGGSEAAVEAAAPAADEVVPAPAAVAPASAPVAPASAPVAPVDARAVAAEGDTNVIEPVAPAPLVTPGSRGDAGTLRCTSCGAALGEDDIFCGACGVVVAHVAQSFTGPIPALPPAAVTPGSAAVPGSVGAPGSVAAPSSAPLAPGLRPAPLAPTPVAPVAAALPPFVPDPEPAPRRRRLFGRRAAERTPELWSSAAQAPAEGAPAASAPAPSSAPANPSPTAASPTAASPTASESAAAASAVPAPVPASAIPAPAPATPAAAVTPPEAPLPPRAVPAVDAVASAPTPPAPIAAHPVEPAVAAPTVIPAVPPVPQPEPSAAPWAVNLGAPSDDDEKTRIVHRALVGDPYVFQFSTGESFTVQGTGLVGRAPVPQPGEAIDLLVRIFDPGRSVSKTHLEFGQEDGHLWISDRWSGNGTVVRPSGQPERRIEPGKRQRVERGTRVEIGEQFFLIN